MLWRYLPLAGMVLLIVIAAGVRPWLQYRLHGTSGVLLFRSGRPGQNWRDAAFVMQVALLVWQAGAAAFSRHPPPLLVAAQGPTHAVLQVVGAVLLFGGIALLAAAQLNMGASWRIGIKEGEAPGLVVSGLYAICRHPIYLGLLTALTGYALLLPTVLSLALLALTYLGVRLQAAAEETYLERAYGAAYRGYARRVGRFLPGIGRLSG